MQATSKTTTRRQFATWLAAATAGAAAAIPATALASPDDDSALLQLEEQVFEAYWAGHAKNEEIYQLGLDEHWWAEFRRLRQEKDGQILSEQEAWDVVAATPEGRECVRLEELRDGHWDRMAGLIDRMWALPAKTEAGRKAKALVLLVCVLGAEWQDRDEEADWHVLKARRLLIDLVGGEAAESLRESFA